MVKIKEIVKVLAVIKVLGKYWNYNSQISCVVFGVFCELKNTQKDVFLILIN